MDNTNSETAATNKAFDLYDLLQIRQTPIMEQFLNRPTNGKRSADVFDDEEEADFGPETDIDTIDDGIVSPTIEAAKALVNNNPLDDVVKMGGIDVDFEVQRQQSKEFEPVRESREETPTPPADSVLDNSGLADNVAESGEDSEDEWNYYRVDPKQKETNGCAAVDSQEEQVPRSEQPQEEQQQPQQPESDNDEMSQLNPDAKEFVPVSPTRGTVSPAYNRDVMDDMLIAQSPRRAVPMNISVPSPVEFQYEVKQRPSDVFEDDLSEKESHELQNGHQLSSQEIMQNLLNGKDVSEIPEFHPSNYKSADEGSNHQFDDNLIFDIQNNKENVAFEPTSESPVSPVKVDDIDFTKCDFVPKPQDPMSMSFYQDKDEEEGGFSTNPFDLNQVQMIPDNVDDIAESVEPKEDTNALLEPAVLNKDSLTPSPAPEALSPAQSPAFNDICELPKTPIQDEVCAKSPVLSEVSDQPASPVQNVCELPKSPMPSQVCDISKSPFLNDECELPKSPLPSEVCEISKSPAHNEVCASPKSPFENDVCEAKSPFKDEICEAPKSPIDICELAKSPIEVDVCEIPKSPLLGVHSPMELSSPVGPLSPKSPIPELTGLVSPDITASIKDENISAEISEGAKSPISQTPIEDVLKSPIQELENELQQVKSPVLEPTFSPDVAKSPLSPVEQVMESQQALTGEAGLSEVSVSPMDLVEDVKEHLQNVEDGITELVDQSANVVEEITQAAESNVDAVLCEMNQEESVQELISDAIGDITSESKKEVTELSAVADQVVESVESPKSPLQETFDTIVEKSHGFGDFIATEAKHIVDEVCELKNEATEIVQEVLNEVRNEVSHIVESSKDLMVELENEVVESAHKLEEMVSPAHSPVPEAVTEIVKQAESLVEAIAVSTHENLNESIVESEVAPSDVNSFLERSEVPDVTSPLSPIEDPQPWRCEYPLPTEHQAPFEIKCETIQPEFPVHTIASPSEESKGTDTPPPTPAVVIADAEQQRATPELQQIVEAVEKLSEEPPATVENKIDTVVAVGATVAAAAASTVAAAVVSKTAASKTAPKKPGTTTTAAKKTAPTKSTPTSPTKPLPAKTSTTAIKKTTTTTSSLAPKVGAAKLTAPKPKTATPTSSPRPATATASPRTTTATRTTPKPRTPATTPTAKPAAEKKPLTNGDVKNPVKQTLLKKTTTTSTTAARPSPTRPAAPSKLSTTTTAKSSTAPAPRAPISRPTTTAAPKPRPSSLTSKTTTSTTITATKSAVSRTSSTTATRTSTVSAPKPRPTTAPAARPRTALTSTKPAAKAPDAEKLIKETANKQLSASRTSTATSRTTTAARKVDSKAPISSRTTTTRTTTTTVRAAPGAKKPTEVSRTTVTKTKSAPVSKPAPEQNGVVSVIQEITTVSSVTVAGDEPQLQLLKDNSPITDNSQLPPAEILAD